MRNCWEIFSKDFDSCLSLSPFIYLPQVFLYHSKTSILYILLLRDRLAFLARTQGLAFLATTARHTRLPSLSSHNRHSCNYFWASDTHILRYVWKNFSKIIWQFYLRDLKWKDHPKYVSPCINRRLMLTMIWSVIFSQMFSLR